MPYFTPTIKKITITAELNDNRFEVFELDRVFRFERRYETSWSNGPKCLFEIGAGEATYHAPSSDLAQSLETDNSPKSGARAKQVGGNHYVKHKIQPWDIIAEYDLDYWEGTALAYLLRRKSDRLEDLKKARHTLDRRIELYEEAGAWPGKKVTANDLNTALR